MIEKDLCKLEEEIDAQKAVFEKMSTQLPVFTNEITYTTKPNPVREFVPPDNEHTSPGNERVVVTLSSETGANTPAVLEIDSDGFKIETVVKRVPFSGGARWTVAATPNYDTESLGTERIDTHYRFVVHSFIDGELEAKMIWE